METHPEKNLIRNIQLDTLYMGYRQYSRLVM